MVAYQLNYFFVFMIFLFNVQLRNKYDDDDDISPYCWSALEPLYFMKFGIRGHLTDVITCVKLLVNRFRSYGV